MIKYWKSMRYHMLQYHGYRHMWMFGVEGRTLAVIHRSMYPWCHKPERDQKRDSL